MSLALISRDGSLSEGAPSFGLGWFSFSMAFINPWVEILKTAAKLRHCSNASDGVNRHGGRNRTFSYCYTLSFQSVLERIET